MMVKKKERIVGINGTEEQGLSRLKNLTLLYI